MRPRSSFVPLIALAALTTAASASAAPSVFVAEATEKIRPSQGARPLGPAHIFAAKNEFEAFQIAVVGSATNVRATATSLTGPGSPISEVRLYREAILDCPEPSSIDGASGPWPDPLVPDVDEFDNQKRNAFPFSVPGGESRVIFVDVYVPKGQAPGDYTGAVTIESDQGNVDVPVTLTVWNFELPSTASLKSAYRLQYGALPTQHGVSGAAFSTLRARYSVMGLDHRISVDWFDDGDPSVEHFDAYYAPLVAGTAGTRMPGAALTNVERPGDPSAYWSYFSSKGWQNKIFDYTCDEPPMTCAWSDIAQRAGAIHAISPAFRTLVTTSIQNADANGATASINVIVPEVQALFPGGGPTVASMYAAFLNQPHNELWMYQSCDVHGCGTNTSPDAVGWPSIMVDASGTRNRAMEWLTFQTGGTGELYYETTMAYTDPGNPWETLYVPSFSGNGDGTLYFPGTPARIGGTTDIPVASYRLKMIREGMEDYEYLKKASDLGGAAFALDVAKTLFPAGNATDVSVADLMAARAKLAAYIVSAAGSMPCQGSGCGGPPTFDAQRMSAAPTIDGNLVEYGASNDLAIGGAGDGSAVVRAGWDADALYLAFAVKDDQLVASPAGEANTWDGDGIELMLDPNSNRTPSADADDAHLLVGASGQLGDSRGWSDYAWSSNAQIAVDAMGAVVPGPAQGGGYRVEMRVAWASIGVTPQPGLTLGFDVAVNDKDMGNGPVASHDWMGLSAFNAPAGWGNLVLRDAQGAAMGSAATAGGSMGSTGHGDGDQTGGCAVSGTSPRSSAPLWAALVGLGLVGMRRPRRAPLRSAARPVRSRRLAWR